MPVVTEDRVAVTEPTSSSLLPFAWVAKRDGRLEPFDADKINRALFAATERLGRPDAFLARELTDGILHFLSAETGHGPLATAQIAEQVVKVVRELGQPELARVFEQCRQQKVTPPATSTGVLEHLPGWVESGPLPGELAGRTADLCLAEYARENVFTRDLIAAAADGLLTLTGLHAPLELAGCVLGPPADGRGLVETIEDARGVAGDFVAMDGPEYAVGINVRAFVRELAVGLRATRLRAVVNLNCPTPPPWAEHLAEGPLFSARRFVPPPERGMEFLEALLEQPGNWRVDWHLAERDFAPESSGRLLRVARLALQGAALAFVFDPPNRAVPLAEGLDRRHQTVLLAVGLHLPRLAAQVEARRQPTENPGELFLTKLRSLSRLALSAALRKREFLRRHGPHRPALLRGFLLERSRLVVTPVGLGAAVEQFMGRSPWSGGAGLEFARQVVQQLHQALRQDGEACRLETTLGHGLDAPLVPEPVWPVAESRKPVADQLRTAVSLHGVGDLGTVIMQAPDATAEELAGLLQRVWRQTDVVRLRLSTTAMAPRQLLAPWEEKPGSTGSIR
jgi:hypothetical protein